MTGEKLEIQTLSQITPYCWRFKENVSVQLYADEALLIAMDKKVKEQILNVAQLPGLVGCAMTMPDAHWGYGFPIGGVAAFDADAGGIISAGGVGFDISCGIRNLRTNLSLDDILPAAETLADELMRAIPAGVGVEGKLKLDNHELDQVMRQGAEWAISQGYGEPEDLLYIEEKGRMKGAEPKNVSELAKKRQHGEMGTLGSGNHYLEIQIVDKIYDQKTADCFGIHENQVLISIHCGSRGLGHQIGTDYLIRLAKAAKQLGIHLPDRELACAPINSTEGQQYLGAMRAAINCALANRQILTQLTRDVFARILSKAKLETLFDVSHNTCKVEKHSIDGQERLLYIHRKGATRAFGPGHTDLPQRYQLVGQPVIIGGSMGTASYVLAGNPPSVNHAFASASHGAGRAMSRKQALKQWSGKQLVTELGANGILIRSRSMRGVAEEAPNAYKDVDKVAEVTEKAGLARKVARLRPKICIKG